ncbi:MAG TPA: PKD domain-containing protein [Caldilineaceae bacterium]|nr:PKD domain-containing protein [Caldilineaceae bacterium]
MSRKSNTLLIALLFCSTALLLFVLQHGNVAAAPASQSDSPLPPPPANDNFGRAKAINALPYYDSVDLTYATRQAREPIPGCAAYSNVERTIWYRYTAPTDGTLLLYANGYAPLISIYRGTSLTDLSYISCDSGYNSSILTAHAGETYYFQIFDAQNVGGYIYFNVRPAPPINVNIYTSWYDPSKYDNIYFYAYVYDEAYQEVVSWLWDFGDGTTSTEPAPTHRFGADGDYVVSLAVMMKDGRTGSSTLALSVRTHDVAIKRFARPKSATVGQTKRLIVSVTNSGYPEDVRVDLYKSIPGGYDYIGFLQQFVDVKAKGKTTDFYLSYTFTKEDLALGKVIFKATAYPSSARDAFPADNEFISFAVTVKPGKVSPTGAAIDDVVASAALDDMSDYATDDVSNVEESLDTLDGPASNETGDGGSRESSDTPTFVNFLPLVSSR